MNMSPEELNKKLSEKYLQVDELIDDIAQLKLRLENEMNVNEELTDHNIKLKGTIREMRAHLKVRVLPSALNRQQDVISEKNVLILELRRALEGAINLIPQDRIRGTYIPGLKATLQKAY